MDDFVEVGLVDELDDGNMMMSTIEEREILVARVGNNFYSADNRCPHMGKIYRAAHLKELLLLVQDIIVCLILKTAM